MKWMHWINALIGIWFLISPWTLGYSQSAGAVWYSVVFGAILLIVSFWAAVQLDPKGWSSWPCWIALIMGILFIIGSFSWNLSTAATWIDVILGVVVVILDLIAMGVAQSQRP